ncbi:MAG: DUF4245 domain-containing protein [Phycicoccus sp.]|nr:DUF4245 domain-containing protein [Phycicoccus sp.]
MGSAANMFRSLVVILALMLGLIFLVPRVNSLSGPVVDIHATAVDVKAQSGWPIVEPRGLPAGWTPTAARYVRATDDKMTWLAGYQTPDGTYVSVEQTESASSEWIAAQINRATRTGEIEHDGVTWVQYERGAKVQNSLVHVPEAEGELATLVTGTATFEDMLVFIDHLVPVE